MIPFSSAVARQIRFALETSKDSDFDSVVRELCEVVLFPVFLFRCFCFGVVELPDVFDVKPKIFSEVWNS